MNTTTTIRRIVTVTFAALAAVPIAACSVDGAPATTTTTNVAAPAAAADTTEEAQTLTPAQQDQVFIRVLRDQGFPLDDAESEAIDLAHTVCETLDAGVPAKRIADATMDTYGPTDAGTLLGAATTTYCPEYTDDFTRLGGAA
ncbi:MAG: DUF732 domain-containing protein [Gordonia sp. (in: high G+C Gram-positive bacteria)]|uniref:DUF732 domain-containing protein n=1 Tax=Gordonia sp. (in: high G+C Gram-positive bacteria) TaxID=84139 RepID=UPI003C72A5E0